MLEFNRSRLFNVSYNASVDIPLQVFKDQGRLTLHRRPLRPGVVYPCWAIHSDSYLLYSNGVQILL